MFGKKKTLGFGQKPRTADEINKLYNKHSLQLGHKLRVHADLESEITEHKLALGRLAAEARTVPQAPPAPAVAITQDEEHA